METKFSLSALLSLVLLVAVGWFLYSLSQGQPPTVTETPVAVSEEPSANQPIQHPSATTSSGEATQSAQQKWQAYSQRTTQQASAGVVATQSLKDSAVSKKAQFSSWLGMATAQITGMDPLSYYTQQVQIGIDLAREYVGVLDSLIRACDRSIVIKQEIINAINVMDFDLVDQKIDENNYQTDVVTNLTSQEKATATRVNSHLDLIKNL